MGLFSYVLDHDYGFAPNPFHGVCTLATCKPKIRDAASVGDVVVGTGCAKRGRRGRLVYHMTVDEIITYDEYWTDERFARKRPSMGGSRAYAFGDNIYHRDAGGNWQQIESFHSMPDGSPNPLNRDHDTHSNRVLLGRRFAYWGGNGPEIPARFRNWNGEDICARRGYRRHFNPALEQDFLVWMFGLSAAGPVGPPADWARMAAGR